MPVSCYNIYSTIDPLDKHTHTSHTSIPVFCYSASLSLSVVRWLVWLFRVLFLVYPPLTLMYKYCLLRQISHMSFDFSARQCPYTATCVSHWTSMNPSCVVHWGSLGSLGFIGLLWFIGSSGRSQLEKGRRLLSGVLMVLVWHFPTWQSL